MSRYLIFGNAENTHVVKWVKALVKHYEVYVISSTSTHSEIHNVLPEDRIFDLNLKVSSGGGNFQLLYRYRQVRDILAQVRPDFVNAHYITSHGFLMALIKRFTKLKFFLVQSAWGTDILVTPFKGRIYKKVTKFALKQAQLITSDAKTMTNVIQSLSKTETMTFSFGLEEMPGIDLKAKEPFLFFSNRMLEENYRIDEVIRFFGRIYAHEPSARLIISHDGTLRNKLEDLVLDLKLEDAIEFKGFVTEEAQEALYRKTQFYISIPVSDATSVSLLEGMAYGCIPIVSDIPANHEWIEQDRNGLYYGIQSLTIKKIRKALEDRKEMAELNRKIIQERAIFPDSIKLYVERISNLLAHAK